MSQLSSRASLSSIVVAASLILGGQQAFATPPAGSAASVRLLVEQLAANQMQASAEIVVKFKDDAAVKPIIDLFWTAPEAAKARFDEFKKSHPVVAMATLARATYSGELVLSFPSRAATTAERLKTARDIAARLSASPDIAYAEPDFSFSTGSG